MEELLMATLVDVSGIRIYNLCTYQSLELELKRKREGFINNTNDLIYGKILFFVNYEYG
jgi:hypothetical protein